LPEIAAVEERRNSVSFDRIEHQQQTSPPTNPAQLHRHVSKSTFLIGSKWHGFRVSMMESNVGLVLLVAEASLSPSNWPRLNITH
jgi:hypothetical protein